MRSVVCALPLAALVAACSSPSPGQTVDSGGGSPAAGCTDDAAIAELGTGDTAFVPVSDGDELPVIHGSQGGNHILGSIRVHHMNPIQLVHFTITAETGEVVSDQTYRILLIEEADCTASAVGLYAYLGFMGGGTESEDIATQLLWTNARMQIDTTDVDGRSVSVAATIVPTPGEPPSEPPVPDTGDTANEPP